MIIASKSLKDSAKKARAKAESGSPLLENIMTSTSTPNPATKPYVSIVDPRNNPRRDTHLDME
jgi:hypothetical protein